MEIISHTVRVKASAGLISPAPGIRHGVANGICGRPLAWAAEGRYEFNFFPDVVGVMHQP
jgi:hypothetical protein